MNSNQKNWSKKQKPGRVGGRDDEKPTQQGAAKSQPVQGQGGERPSPKIKQQSKNRPRGKGRFQGKEKQTGREWERQKERPSGNNRPQVKDEPLFRKEDLPVLVCAICEKDIQNVHTAIAMKGKPVHLDCAIAMVQQNETLKPEERVCYIGGGAFGVVVNQPGNQGKITIKKRIQFEENEKEQKCEWRKTLGKFVGDRIAKAR